MNYLTLLGDSIFDNGAYVPNEAPVIEQLKNTLENSWQATLLAVDGDVTTDVYKQIPRMPADTTHCILSCGGNDALRMAGMLDEKASSVMEVMSRFAEVRATFRNNYSNLINALLSLNKPLAVCTIYDSVPGIEDGVLSALALFNEIILKEAFREKLPVIDLRLVFNQTSDYSYLSPIEPSNKGGAKLVAAIATLLESHDFAIPRTVIYA